MHVDMSGGEQYRQVEFLAGPHLAGRYGVSPGMAPGEGLNGRFEMVPAGAQTRIRESALPGRLGVAGDRKRLDTGIAVTAVRYQGPENVVAVETGDANVPAQLCHRGDWVVRYDSHGDYRTHGHGRDAGTFEVFSAERFEEFFVLQSAIDGAELEISALG